MGTAGDQGAQGQTLNSQSQRGCRGKESRGPTWQCPLPQLTLDNLAGLDTLAVNHYELQLQVTCGALVMEGPLSVDVQRDPDHIQCAGRFISPGETRGGRRGRAGMARTEPP